jgi:zinc protease
MRPIRRASALLAALFALASAGAARSCGVDAPDVTNLTLANGARVILQPDANSDFVAVCVFIKAGAAAENGQSGLGNLTAKALFGSNTNQSSDAVRRYIYSTGGSLEVLWTPDYTLFACVTTRAAFQDAFYVIAQAVKGAEFDADTLARARKQAALDADRETTEPYRVAYAALRKRLYESHPYRSSLGGTAERVTRVPAQAVKSFYARNYTPANTVVAIVGNVPVKEAQAAVENQFFDFVRPQPQPLRSQGADTMPETGRSAIKTAGKTAWVLAGFRAPGVADSDYPAFAVLQALLGGGKSSRVFRSVRDVAGVGYAVGTSYPVLERDSHLVAYVEYDPARSGTDGKPVAAEVVETLLADAARSVLTSPPTEVEVERARRYVIGGHALAHQRARDRAFYLGLYEARGVGAGFDAEFPKKVAAVTSADVKRVAEKYLGRWAVVVAQPQ